MWWCCGETTPIIPNVIGWGCVNIDKTDPENWIIEAPCPTEVISSNDSVLIEETEWESWEKIFDLSFECCDNKVWATPNDPNPGSLEEKLFVQWPYLAPSILSESYTITLDFDALSNDLPDELVKANANGNSNFLDNLLTAESPLQRQLINVDNYQVQIDKNANDWKRPWGSMLLSSNFELSWLPNDNVNLSQVTWFSWVSNDAAQLANANVWTCTKTWAYRISFHWLIEVNEGINAVRVVNTFTGSTSNGTSLDWKMGSGNASRWIDNTASAWTSIYDGTPLSTISWSAIVQVNSWDTMAISIRRDTNQDDNVTDWKIRIVGAWWSPFTWLQARWFHFDWDYIWDIF